MCIHTLIDTFRDSRSNNTLKAAVAFLMPFSIKRNLGFLKKWLSPGLGRLICHSGYFLVSPIYFPTIHRYFSVPEFDLFTFWLNGTCLLRLFYPFPPCPSFPSWVCPVVPSLTPNCNPNLELSDRGKTRLTSAS